MGKLVDYSMLSGEEIESGVFFDFDSLSPAYIQPDGTFITEADKRKGRMEEKARAKAEAAAKAGSGD